MKQLLKTADTVLDWALILFVAWLMLEYSVPIPPDTWDEERWAQMYEDHINED